MNLEERLAHLQWRKVCNDSQIQGALKQSKQLHDRDMLLNATEAKNASKWVRKVVQDEITKPLQISSGQYEQILHENEQETWALERAGQIHARSIATIQDKIKQREQHAKRQRHYRKHKQQLLQLDNNAHYDTKPLPRDTKQH